MPWKCCPPPPKKNPQWPFKVMRKTLTHKWNLNCRSKYLNNDQRIPTTYFAILHNVIERTHLSSKRPLERTLSRIELKQNSKNTSREDSRVFYNRNFRLETQWYQLLTGSQTKLWVLVFGGGGCTAWLRYRQHYSTINHRNTMDNELSNKSCWLSATL